ncbi:MAG: metallophosphoesterase [Verrucomicrobiota bacterium]
MLTFNEMLIERAYEFGGDVDWEVLSSRLGRDELLKRVARQNLHYRSRSVRWKRFFSRQLIKHAAEWGFRLTGISGLGHRNFRDIQIIENPIEFSDLPNEFDKFRILQISDLHLDLDPGLADVVVEKILPMKGQYDLAVLTGDFRNATYGDFHPALALTEKIVNTLDSPIYGVLGNHDYLEMAPRLESMGVCMLLNESTDLEHNGAKIALVGIDDPHLYQTDNMDRATADVCKGVFSILLSHAPETFEQAEAAGFNLFLCGHTHGGQICLPGGYPIVTHCEAPRFCSRGNWAWKRMKGFTTTGTGGCGAALRLNCPPEVVIHELKRSV